MVYSAEIKMDGYLMNIRTDVQGAGLAECDLIHVWVDEWYSCGPLLEV